MTWEELQFWQSLEWQQTQEWIDEMDRQGVKYTPKRENLFSALDATPFNEVRVCILGQDPYPQAGMATGLAFSIPRTEKTFPPTLINIFKEYCEDLHYPFPQHGDLSSWAKQGVLMWNVFATCKTGSPGSHRTHWSPLTLEIIQRLQEKGIIFVLLGGLARDYLQFIDIDKNTVMSYSHPSPLGASKTKSPFLGSRIFSTINSYLNPSIDWRLD